MRRADDTLDDGAVRQPRVQIVVTSPFTDLFVLEIYTLSVRSKEKKMEVMINSLFG